MNEFESPELTAYALGEVSAEDRARIERQLEQDILAREFVEEIRTLAGMVSRELKSEPHPLLFQSQREALQHRADHRKAATYHKRIQIAFLCFAYSSVAALVLAMFQVSLPANSAGSKNGRGRPYSAVASKSGDRFANPFAEKAKNQTSAPDFFERIGIDIEIENDPVSNPRLDSKRLSDPFDIGGVGLGGALDGGNQGKGSLGGNRQFGGFGNGTKGAKAPSFIENGIKFDDKWAYTDSQTANTVQSNGRNLLPPTNIADPFNIAISQSSFDLATQPLAGLMRSSKPNRDARIDPFGNSVDTQNRDVVTSNLPSTGNLNGNMSSTHPLMLGDMSPQFLRDGKHVRSVTIRDAPPGARLNLPIGRSPTNGARSDLAQTERPKETASYQRIVRVVNDSFLKASQQYRTDPKGALQTLQVLLAGMKGPGEADQVTAKLSRTVEKRIRAYGLEIAASGTEEKARQARSKKIIPDIERNKFDVFLRAYDEKFKRGELDEAVKIAKNARDSNPDELWGYAAEWKARALQVHSADLETSPKLASEWSKVLKEVQRSTIPFPDDPAVAFIAPNEWEELSVRRQSFRNPTTGAKGSGKDRIEHALEQTIDLKFSQTPLCEIIDFLRDYHQINIIVDEQILKAAGVNEQDPITISVAEIKTKNCLKQILEPRGLTYVIEDEVLKIVELKSTSARKKALEKSTPQKTMAKTWKRSRKSANTSRVMVGDNEELAMKGLQVNVRIDGFRARVLLDGYYYNDRSQTLEGNFQLQLPNEASPYFLAFGETVYQQKGVPSELPVFLSLNAERTSNFSPSDIMAARADTWNQPKEARMVPKDKAAYAYRETVARQVDPAIMEWSGAGIFSARVFPLAPKKLHRIVIGYDADLVRVGEDFEFKLELPELDGDTVIDLAVAKPEGSKLKVIPAKQGAQTSERTYYRFENPKEESIAVRLEKVISPLLCGNDEATGPCFAARFRPEIPAVEAKLANRSAIFLVDTSLSSNPDKFNIWLKLLRSVLDQNKDSIPRFAVLFFNIETRWWKDQFVENTPANREALLEFANGLSLEGATDLSAALREAAKPSWLSSSFPNHGHDLFLLSDGGATWGELAPMAIALPLKSTPCGTLFTYSTGFSGTNSALLSFLARESGGSMFTVAKEEEIDKVAIAHRLRPWQIEKMTVAEGSDLMLAGRPNTIYSGQELLLVGRGVLTANASVELTVRQGNELRIVKTSLGRPIASELAARTYGQVAVGQLEEFQSHVENWSQAYSNHFRIVGQTCSLLMLDTEADYQRYNIKPEDEALVVRINLASDVIARTLVNISQRIVDPKGSFTSWLARLEKAPGIKIQVSPVLRAIIDSLPAGSFSIRRMPLHCRAASWLEIGGNTRERLSRAEVDPEWIRQESMRRLAKFGAADALKALSSGVESRPGDLENIRELAFAALEWKLPDQACQLFRRVIDSRPFEPLAYHQLARSLSANGQSDLAILYFELALAIQWDDRFGDQKQIIAMDYIRLLRQITTGQQKSSLADFATIRRKSIASMLTLDKCDLVVFLSWTTDQTDVDLHVTEPTGEECFYSHQSTNLGGRLTKDVTTGYGPEMYSLAKAAKGKYVIGAHYYSGNRNRASAQTKVLATIVQNWGKPDELITEKVVTLSNAKEKNEIMTLHVN